MQAITLHDLDLVGGLYLAGQKLCASIQISKSFFFRRLAYEKLPLEEEDHLFDLEIEKENSMQENHVNLKTMNKPIPVLANH
jgi:hypothetical protein